MNGKRGSRHYRWNSARMLSTEGYAKIRVGYEHPLADPNGYCYEHLLIWVSAGNPRPRKDQVLIFKNGERADTRLRNLQLIPRKVLLARNNVYIAQDRRGRFVSEKGAAS